jgi:ADP-ribose pyrophosphatase
VKPIQTESVYATPWFDLVAKTMREGEAPYYSLHLPDYVGVLAVTAEERVLAVRQYRPALERYTIELPAGLVDPGETAEGTARREMLEETGYEAAEMQVLGEMSTDNGRLDNRIWACFAPRVCKVAGYQAETDVETKTYSVGELMQAVREGEFNHALHVAILMLACLRGAIKAF